MEQNNLNFVPFSAGSVGTRLLFCHLFAIVTGVVLVVVVVTVVFYFATVVLRFPTDAAALCWTPVAPHWTEKRCAPVWLDRKS